MIHYTLVCDAEHEFEGWFRSSSDFDRQAEAGDVTCPVCGSVHVRRGLMAPAIATRGGSPVPEAAAVESPSAAGAMPVAMPALAEDPRARALIEMMREVRRVVEANADYVGNRFPDEARKIHYGDAEARGIYGEASAADVEALVDEGIEIHPLPLLPEDRN